MSVAARLAALGIVLPAPSVPLANYVPWVRTGVLVAVAGQIPLRDGEMAYAGAVSDATLADGVAAARLCFINMLAQVQAACEGDLDRVRQVVRLGGIIAAPANFTQHQIVMNGASDLAVDVFGPVGRHARTTVGAPSLPRNAMVEIDGWFELA